MTASEEFRVDLHVKVLNDRVVDRAIAAGFDAVVYAPHFTRLPEIQARAERYSNDDLLVVPAREVFTGSWRERKHVLAIGLSDPVPDFVSLEAAMVEFDRQNAAVLAPHPEYLNVSLTESDLRIYRDTVDAVEIYNPKHLPSHNRRARELAEQFDYPPFASSYAHLPGSVGGSHTAFDADLEIESVADLVAALREGAPRRVVSDTGFSRWKTTVCELGHLGWENTWKKADRLFLQGTEPTHPRHIAYDGQFDDVSVY